MNCYYIALSCVYCLLLCCSLTSSLFAEGASDRRLVSFGLVADSHYDTFPAGEKAPWQPLDHWFREQQKRTTTRSKRRYDLALDKMEEAVEVFNKLYATDGGRIDGKNDTASDVSGEVRAVASLAPQTRRPRLDFAVNLGDLVNNDLMWNLKPILDAFGEIKAPHFHLLGNHDLRAHNDRFGKVNKTQHKWIQEKMVGKGNEWYFAVDYAPFRLIFINSMIMEPEGLDAEKRRIHLEWLSDQLGSARQDKRAVLLFAHIPIGVVTNVMGPTLKAFDDVIIAAFFGHDHKGGYIQQGSIHSVTINGQIETMVNAFAVVEVFEDRIELTGFGRVPSRVMPIISPSVREWLASYEGPLWHDLTSVRFQPLPKASRWRVSGEGGAAAQDEVEEALQEPPPLSLNIPNYKKPLIPYVSPNPGNLLFLSQVYSTWPRRVRAAPAKEAAIDLNSAHKGAAVLLIDNEHVRPSVSSTSEDEKGGDIDGEKLLTAAPLLPADRRDSQRTAAGVRQLAALDGEGEAAVTSLHKTRRPQLPRTVRGGDENFDKDVAAISNANNGGEPMDPLGFALIGSTALTAIFGLVLVVRNKRIRYLWSKMIRK